MWVASKVAKQLWTHKTLDLRKLVTIRAIPNLGGDRAQCLVSLPETKFW